MITLAAAGTLQGIATSATTVTYALFGKELAGATETFKPLGQGQLPSSAGVLYTVPASTAAVVEEITLTNTGSTAQTVTLYVSGAAAANEIGSFVIPADGSATYNGEWTVYDSLGYPQLSGLSEIQKGNLYVTGPRPWVDAVAYGADPTGGSDSRAAINAALTAASAGRGMVYLPAGNYFVSGTLTVPAFVHLTGAGQYITVIAPTFSTGDVLTLGGGSSIENLWILGQSAITNAGGTLSGTPQTVAVSTTQNFPTSGTGYIGLANGTWTTFSWTGTTPTSFTGVTGSGAFNAGTAVMLRSSGSAISTGADSLWRVANLRIDMMYDGISSAGVGCTVDTVNLRNIVRYGVNINGDAANPYLHNVVMDNDYAKSTAGVEVAQGTTVMSDVQIMRCQWGMDINPTGTGVFSLYCINSFFDNCSQAGLNVQGTGTFQRSKFAQCWFSSATNGVVLNNPNASGIDFFDCDIYLNTATGFLATACAEWALTGSRLASNTTAGVQVSASTPASEFVIAGNLIGAETGGLSGNGQGIVVGAGTYSNIRIVDNNLTGNTGVALSDSSTVNNPNQKVVLGNTGLSNAPVPLVTTPPNITTTTETIVHQMVLPANSLLVGTTIRFTAFGSITATTPTLQARLRVGTAGTTADAQVCATVTAVVQTGAGWVVEGFVTIRSVGSGGTCLGNAWMAGGNAAGGMSAQTATVAVNTTVANFLSLSLKGGTSGITVTTVNAFAEVVRQ